MEPGCWLCGSHSGLHQLLRDADGSETRGDTLAQRDAERAFAADDIIPTGVDSGSARRWSSGGRSER
jgi:hypothetical protein